MIDTVKSRSEAYELRPIRIMNTVKFRSEVYELRPIRIMDTVKSRSEICKLRPVRMTDTVKSRAAMVLIDAGDKATLIVEAGSSCLLSSVYVVIKAHRQRRLFIANKSPFLVCDALGAIK